MDDHVYAYDADGNVIAKDDLVTPAGGQTFGYDNLNRITSFAQGVISDGAIASPASSQGWTYDVLGNQLAVTSNGTPVSQTFNSQNQADEHREHDAGLRQRRQHHDRSERGQPAV